MTFDKNTLTTRRQYWTSEFESYYNLFKFLIGKITVAVYKFGTELTHQSVRTHPGSPLDRRPSPGWQWWHQKDPDKSCPSRCRLTLAWSSRYQQNNRTISSRIHGDTDSHIQDVKQLRPIYFSISYSIYTRYRLRCVRGRCSFRTNSRFVTGKGTNVIVWEHICYLYICMFVVLFVCLFLSW